MKEKSIYLIFNPAAQAGKAQKALSKILKILNATKIPYSHQLTKRPGHAYEIARKIVRHKTAKVIIAGGGDGTVREVASALLRTDLSLAVLPLGIGNDFANNLALPKDLKELLELLKSGKEIEVDVLELTSQKKKFYAVNIFSIGFDAEVALWIQKLIILLTKIKKLKLLVPKLEYFVYLLGVFLKMFFFKEKEVKITAPQFSLQSKILMVACANGQREGKHFKIAPKASLNDGLIDVCIIGKIPPWQRIFYVLKSLQGKHLSLKKVYYFKTPYLKIISPSGTPLLAHLDGEPLYLSSEIELKILPKALKVIIPPTN